jgi:hypothetical protein
MSQITRREFSCDVYRTDGIDAYPSRAELFIGTTAAFLVRADGRVRKLSIGEDASVHNAIEGSDPLREEILELFKYEGAFYTTDSDVEEISLGQHYLVDGETVITPTSKTSRVAEKGPIDAITDDEFMPDHEDVYVIQRQNPFGRFQYRTNRARRFVRSDRVEKLVTVAPA